MVTHDNIVFEARVCMGEGVQMVGGKPTDEERIISYLPLSHVAGQMIDVLCPITVTSLRPGVCSVFFARPYDLKIGTLGDRLRMVKPTVFLGVPRVWEKIAEKMKAVGAKVTGTKKKIANWAKSKGLEYQHNMQLGGTGAKPSNYGLAEKLILSKVKSALGMDEMKFGFTGAAPITTDTLEFFGALGININEVYGMSECTGATTWSTDEAHIWGTVGFPLLGMEVKIFKMTQAGKKECPRAKALTNIPDECQGEICFRGRHIMMGYLANPDMGEEHVQEMRKKNAEAIDEEGWLHSGDMGVKTVQGMIKITGRYKELIIGAGGENIAPVPIEDEAKKVSNGVISNIQMIGDKRKYNVALLTLACKGATGERAGTSELDGPAAALVPGVKTIAEASASKEFIAFLENCLKKVNSNGAVCPSSAAKIAKFTILPIDFSVEGDELTATLKLKRGVVEKKYIKAVDAMYEGAEGGGMFVPFKA
jgi:long-chain-fatty-acid--CoA ligase ACSBG